GRTAISLAAFCVTAAAVRLALESQLPLVQIVAGAVASSAVLLAVMAATGVVERRDLTPAGARSLLARDGPP
ncbi:MAG TPA: hypothetical protein VM684_21030, partial [Gaiellales bacterium]|nr:hypothetical protein [Gaiellales bacterium]